MPSCSIYEPCEDSAMLERHARQLAKGKVLDVGTGSGIQSIAAAQSKNVNSVIAVDIQKGVIKYCKKNIQNRKIKFLYSDLFEAFKKNKKLNLKFDTIIFNPPYLPEELKLKDLTVEGGKKGYEVIERFLADASNFLQPDGIILMALSSLTKKEKVEELIRNNLFDFRELEKIHIFFEDIYIYILNKSELLKRLENKKIKNVKYFTKGHRGLLFTGTYKNKKTSIKAKNPQSSAEGRIQNEARWLKMLNKYGIGPKLLLAEDDYFAYSYIDGDFIIDFFRKSSKNKIRKTIKNILNQMFALDKLKIDKEEMHHPLKHVIVSKDKTYLIDFERTHRVKNPKNVTQFCQFLISGYVSSTLDAKEIIIGRQRMMDLAKIYKSKMNLENFKKIAEMI